MGDELDIYRVVIDGEDKASAAFNRAAKTAERDGARIERILIRIRVSMAAVDRANMGSGRGGFARSVASMGKSAWGFITGPGKRLFNFLTNALRSAFTGVVWAAGGAAAAVAAFTASAIAQAVKMDSLKRALANAMGGYKGLRKEMLALRELAKLPGIGYEESIEGSVKLQSAGFTPGGARRLIQGTGNAVAAAGGGKDEIKWINIAYSQIASKGKVQAEEVNQIAERMPQIRQVLKDAFGTSDTEAIQKMKLTSEQFFNALATGLEKLPRITGGAQNSIDNLVDTFNIFRVSFGEQFLSTLDSVMQRISNIFSFLSESGVAAGIGKGFAASLERVLGGDGIERVAFTLVATFERLPEIIAKAWDAGKTFATEFGNGLINAINAVGQGITTIVNLFTGGIRAFQSGAVWLAEKVVGIMPVWGEDAEKKRGYLSALKETRAELTGPSMTWETIPDVKGLIDKAVSMAGMSEERASISARADELMRQAAQFAKRPAGKVEKYTGPMMKPEKPTPPENRSVRYLRDIERNTREQTDISRILLGTGARNAGSLGDIFRARAAATGASQQSTRGSISVQVGASDVERAMVGVVYTVLSQLGIPTRAF